MGDDRSRAKRGLPLLFDGVPNKRPTFVFDRARRNEVAGRSAQRGAARRSKGLPHPPTSEDH